MSKRRIHLHVVSDGVDALEFLRRKGPNLNAPRPDLIILDLNLPRMDGRELLPLIKNDDRLKSIPVVVLSTSEAEADILKSYELQASCYYTKPVGLDAFIDVVKNLNDWLTQIKLPQKSIMRVLLVEADLQECMLIHAMLKEEGSANADLVHATSMSQAKLLLAAQSIDIIVLDPALPDANGLDAIRQIRAIAPRVPVVVLADFDDETMAAVALQEGVQHYLVKNRIDARALLLALRHSIERKSMEEALYGQQERAQVTLDSIGDAVACSDMAGTVTFLNNAAEKMTGWSRREAAGRPMTDVLRILDAGTREAIPDPMELAVDRNSTMHLPPNCILLRRDGIETPIEDCVSPIHDRQGQITGAVIVFRDVTEARALAQQATHAAGHDFLSGLPNRKLLKERIAYAIALARRHMTTLAVLFLDLDGFKHVNDSFGHPVGDRLLQSVAERLTQCVHGTDTVSRQGGDEFIVLLADVKRPEEVSEMATRMLEAVAEAHTIDEHTIHVATSIGVSVYPHDGLDAETLIKNADTAMYHAKENGRHRYQFYEPAMCARTAERQFIVEGLRQALKRNEFRLYYQPQIDLATETIVGAEALIRWMHPTRGAIPPGKFIPVAEACGLIVSIDAWVLRQACAQTVAWADAGLPAIAMAVNVSATELQDETYVDRVFALLAETRLDPKALVLELTESVLVKRTNATASILRKLRKSGIKIAIDDFGTGYSSLNYLQRFPVDILKIDRSFIRQISAAGDKKHIVTAVIAMARALKLRVVAEGVEKLEELLFLRAQHCDEVQGYFYGAPMPAEDFAKLLAAGLQTPLEAQPA
ncbi:MULTISPECIES: EAL domain-containing protein [Rhodomicrobium]|uniref:EAL domain-containing protein n=1 Tax=Rhodomicrobium TaxID=1068 RepID=UPI000B4ADBF3|nr:MULTISPECIES: EAL domain-containing protein [Rhodomicrobium]